MNDCYFRQYHAEVRTDTLHVIFYRLYTDSRDIMCDSLKPQWEPLDKFIITIRELATTHFSEPLPSGKGVATWDDVQQTDELEFRTSSKQVANYIWYLAKHGADFDTIKEMHETQKFR